MEVNVAVIRVGVEERREEVAVVRIVVVFARVLGGNKKVKVFFSLLILVPIFHFECD